MSDTNNNLNSILIEDSEVTTSKQKKTNLNEVICNLIPNIANSIMYFFVGIIETHFVGQKKDIDLLDGVGLGLLYNNVLFYFLGVGLSESMAVTLPKAFGSRNFKLISNQTNQVRIMICCFFIVFLIINLFFSFEILSLIAHSDKPYVKIAHQYVIYSMPALLFDLNSEIYFKFSESQLFYSPIFVSLFVSCVTHVTSCYFLISVYDLGVIGCALSTNITNVIKFLVVFFYVKRCHPYPESNTFSCEDVFKDFFYMLKVSVLSMITYFSECVAFSISSIVGNKLSQISYSKQIVISNLLMINYSFAYAWMNTVCILVSNYIGENSEVNVKKSIKFLLYLGIGCELILMLIFYFFRDYLFFFFSEDESISHSEDLRNYYIYFLMVLGTLDFCQAFLVGILKGFEILHFTTIFSAILFLVVHPILSSVLALNYEMDLSGIYISEFSILVILTISWLCYICFIVDIKQICSSYQKEYK
jgi:Na+-driven multidrug efflux pump